MPKQNDRSQWEELAGIFAAEFLKRDRDDWAGHFAATDACVSPVLDMDESARHPLAVERNMFRHADGVSEPRPAPRFSLTPGEIGNPPPDARMTTWKTLAAWGVSGDKIDALAAAGVIPC
mgnify:CR=1 FL=1